VADWRQAYAENPNLFDTCSLIVSALGIWNPEVASICARQVLYPVRSCMDGWKIEPPQLMP
jgi:hypothetical protein